MDWLKHFQKYQLSYMLGAFGVLWFINAVTLATSRIMEEYARDTSTLPFQFWEPFVWEFSSAIFILILVPALSALLQSRLLSWHSPLKSIMVLIGASLIFSLVHVVGMVLARELIYFLAGSNYQFGSVWFGFFYEYRKDFVTFFLLLCSIKGYRYIESRLQNEANLIQYEGAEPQAIDRILVKKLGREFIVKVDEVEWFESSGNYVNLHVGNSVYPIRNTMAAMALTLEINGFCRIHRSFAVKLSQVKSIESDNNGAGNVELLNGKSLPISRRYRDDLRLRLGI